MKIALLNNDLRVYWKQRAHYLHQFLWDNNIEFQAIELFGKGSPYAFDSHNAENDWWNCLFPDKSADDVSAKEIEEVVFTSLDKIKPDIIIAPSIVFYAGALGLRWAKRNNKRFIMFDDAKPAQVKRNFLVQWVKNTIIRQVDGFWLPSVDYEKDYATFLKSGVHLFYGYNSVDNDHFKFENRKTFNHKSIISVSRLVPKKNIGNLLRAWQLVERYNSEYKLAFIGNGPDEGELKELTNALNLNNVTFLGIVNNRDIPGYFYQCDAFILASLTEEWALVVNEAMAAGLPVLLSSTINAGQSLLENGFNGFSFDPLDIEGMAEAIVKYISLSEAAKEKMSARALQLIDVMSYQNMGNKLLAAIKEINTKPYKKPALIASLMIGKWSGRYDTSGWDKVS